MKPITALVVGSLLGLGIVLAALHWRDRPVVQIGQDGTPTALIPRGDLRAKDITPFVTSPAVAVTVKRVIDAGARVQVVAETRGTVKVPLPTFNNVEPPRFAEQKVEAVAVVSTDKQGQPTADLRVYTVQPDGTRQELPDARTSIVAAQPQQPHWRLGLALQAGVGLSSSVTGKRSAVAVVAVPWLRKTSNGTAEGSTWALLTPALVTDGKTAQPAILPFTYNVARFIPLLQDIHAGPLVAFDIQTQTVRAGLAIAATF